MRLLVATGGVLAIGVALLWAWAGRGEQHDWDAALWQLVEQEGAR